MEAAIAREVSLRLSGKGCTEDRARNFLAAALKSKPALWHVAAEYIEKCAMAPVRAWTTRVSLCLEHYIPVLDLAFVVLDYTYAVDSMTLREIYVYVVITIEEVLANRPSGYHYECDMSWSLVVIYYLYMRFPYDPLIQSWYQEKEEQARSASMACWRSPYCNRPTCGIICRCKTTGERLNELWQPPFMHPLRQFAIPTRMLLSAKRTIN